MQGEEQEAEEREVEMEEEEKEVEKEAEQEKEERVTHTPSRKSAKTSKTDHENKVTNINLRMIAS